MANFIWIDDAPNVSRLFEGERYVGKLFVTQINGYPEPTVTFVRASDHHRYKITSIFKDAKAVLQRMVENGEV